MKKSIGVLVLMAIVFSLATFSCSQKQTTTKYTIGFSQCNSSEPWREAMNKEIMTEGGVQAVLDGQLSATFLYPAGGKEAIKIAKDILSGKKVKNSLLWKRKP